MRVGADSRWRCTAIPPMGYRHLAKDQKDAESTIEDEPAHYAPCADGCRAHDHRLGESRQMMTRKVLRCVAPAPSRICDGGFDSLGHGGALKKFGIVTPSRMHARWCSARERAPWNQVNRHGKLGCT